MMMQHQLVVVINILVNYFESVTSTDVEEVCKKEPSFAGFWFEKRFFSHYKKCQTKICFEAQNKNSEISTIEFNSFSVMMLQSSKEKRFVLQESVLYELKRAHPIIDCVGNLSDTTSQKWLVFIQISLQPYHEHKIKLSKLFCSNLTNWKGFFLLHNIKL